MAVIGEFPEDLSAYRVCLDEVLLLDRDSTKIEVAIKIAESLVRRCPDDAEAHHLLGLAWYHFPIPSSYRSWRCRLSLERAIDLDPDHQFALQYLAYLAFDQEGYADALAILGRVRAEYFIERDQEWRALKNLELRIVCLIRLMPDSFPLREFEEFARWYRDVRRREREDFRFGSSVLPQELRECAEWLFEVDTPISDARLQSMLAFLAERGYINAIRNSALRSYAAEFVVRRSSDEVVSDGDFE